MNKILDEFKNNIFIKIVYSIIFSFMIIIDKNIVYNGNIFSKINEYYINSFNIFDYLLLLAIIILTYIFLSIIIVLLDNKNIKILNKKIDKKIYVLIFILLLIAWLPYVLSYFPFGIYYDTEVQIKQAIGHHLNNRHPIFNTMIITLFVDIGKSFNNLKLGLQLYSIFQLLVSLFTITYFISWLAKKGISNKYIFFTTLFYMFFPIFPLYVVSFWKDTLFSIFLFLYVINLIDISIKNKDNLLNIKNILYHCSLIFLVAFSRNNGIYIVLISRVFVIKKCFNNKLFRRLCILELLCITIIQIPIFNYLKINTPFSENLGVPIQQISYVVSDHGKIEKSDKKIINNIIPIDVIKEVYTPAIADKIKFDSNFNEEYLEKNKVSFFKVWFHLLRKNPNRYVKAYLLNTIGFYDIFKSSDVAYINTTNWPQVDEDLGITQDDYIKTIFGKSIRNILEPKYYISVAIFVWVLLLSIVLCLVKKKTILYLIPLLITVATLFLAVPLAFSFRYLFVLVLSFPLIIISPLLNNLDS